MLKLLNQLPLARCPYCQIARPFLNSIHSFDTNVHDGSNRRTWKIYRCSTCGGVVTAAAREGGEEVIEHYPEMRSAHIALPLKAREFLNQAIESLHAPAGAIMLCASAIDAMLKARGLTRGSLYARIDQARDDHLITADVSAWAHEVRLDANDHRHADEDASLPVIDDARKCIDFTEALGEILFILPARVTRGREEAAQSSNQRT